MALGHGRHGPGAVLPAERVGLGGRRGGSRSPASAAPRASSCSPRSARPGATRSPPTRLHVRIEDDVTTQAAKRVLVSGDAGLLERRAADLARRAGSRSPRSTAGSRVWRPGRAAEHRRRPGRRPQRAGPRRDRPGRSARARPRRTPTGPARARRAAARRLPGRGRADRRADAARAARAAAALRASGELVPRRARARPARRRGHVGALGRTVDIHRLVVDPAGSAAGIASALLDALAEGEPDARRTIVDTATRQPPGRRALPGARVPPVRSARRGGVDRGSCATSGRRPGGMLPARLASVTRLRAHSVPAPRAGGRDRRARRRGPGRLLVLACSASPRCRCSARPSRPTTRGRGSSGAARSPSSTSTRRAARPGSRCRSSSRRRSRCSATTAAPDLWLVIARAGGLLAVAMAYRLGSRLAGRAAGVDRRRLRCCSPTSSCATSRAATRRGCSSRSCLWAIERHLDGRRTDAFLLGFAAGAAAPRGVAVPRALRAVARVARAAPAPRSCSACFALRRAVVRAGVLGLGRPAARREPRAPAQPGLRRLRRRRSSRSSAARAPCSRCPCCSGRSSAVVARRARRRWDLRLALGPPPRC